MDIGEELKQLLLAGIGALATGAEKSSDLIDKMIKRGELTVEQGKALNEELKKKRDTQKKQDDYNSILSKLSGLDPHQRVQLIELLKNLDVEKAKAEAVDVEAEVVDDAAEEKKEADE